MSVSRGGPSEGLDTTMIPREVEDSSPCDGSEIFHFPDLSHVFLVWNTPSGFLHQIRRFSTRVTNTVVTQVSS